MLASQSYVGYLMVEPGLSPEQRLARVAELRGEANDVMKNLRTRMGAVQKAQQQALGVVGEAWSRDGGVHATVDATGVLTELELSPSVMREGMQQRLAAMVVATVQQAATAARARMQQELAPLTEPGALAAARAAVPGLAGLKVPEVPRTATDPSADAAAPTESKPEPKLDAVRQLDDAHDDEDLSQRSMLDGDEW